MCRNGKTPVNRYGSNEGLFCGETFVIYYSLGCVKWLGFENLVVTLRDNLSLFLFILGVFSPVVFQNSNLKRRPLHIAVDSSQMFRTTRVWYVSKTHTSTDLLFYT